MPLQVVVRLRSPKLEFPEGDDDRAACSTEPSTRIDIPVRARDLGRLPAADRRHVTPDGERRLAMSRYTVRSTAVSGVGLVLSIGAGAVPRRVVGAPLARTRRSARLVAASDAAPRAAGSRSELGCRRHGRPHRHRQQLRPHRRGGRRPRHRGRAAVDPLRRRGVRGPHRAHASRPSTRSWPRPTVLPETAAPAPGQFEAAFRRQQAAGADAVVCINLSSDLSATMQSAQNAAKAHRRRPRRARRRLAARSPPASAPRCCSPPRPPPAARRPTRSSPSSRTWPRRTHVVGALDTLDNLKKGGRIGGAQALLGSLLSIKPIVDISTGKVEEAGKARTRKKALEVLRDKVAEAGADRAPLRHPRAGAGGRRGARPARPALPPRRDPRRAHRPGHRHPRRPAGHGRHLGRAGLSGPSRRGVPRPGAAGSLGGLCRSPRRLAARP